MITKLTPKQERDLIKFRQECLQIGLDTSRVDRQKAEDVISRLYNWGGFQTPKFIHLSSPMMCELYINLISGNQLGAQLRDQLWDQLGEVTGHHHIVEQATMYEDPFGNLFALVEKETILKHHEHGAIILEPGIYQFGLNGVNQVEYSGEEERRVRD